MNYSMQKYFFPRAAIFYLAATALFIYPACDLEEIAPGSPPPTFEQHFVAAANTNVTVASVVEAVDSGFIVSGYLTYTNFNGTSLFVCKTTPSGSVQQTVVNFGLTGSSTGGKLIRTTDNHYLLVGTGNLPGDNGGDGNMVAIKLKPDLTSAWKVSLGTAAIERGTAVVETADGHCIIAGSQESGTEEDPYFFKVRADNGAKVDEGSSVFSGVGRYRPVSIVKNGSAYGLICYNFSVSILSPYFIKINDNLDAAVQKSLGNVGNGNGEITAGNADGFVLADGFSAQTGAHAYLLSLNGNGDELGEFNLFGSAEYSGLYTMTKTDGGKYVPAGWAQFPSAANGVAVAALVSSAFNTEKSYQYPTNTDFSDFTAVAALKSGGYVLAGRFGLKEILLVRLNANFTL